MLKIPDLTISVLGGTPEWDDLAKHTVTILNRVLTARKLQSDEELPYVDDLEIAAGTEQQSNSSTMKERRISRKSIVIPKLKAAFLEKSSIPSLTSKAPPEGYRQVAVVLPKGDLDCKTLVKHFSKLSQVKEKSGILLVFLRGSTPLLDKDHPQNCKNCLKFWNFSKCQIADEEACVDEVIKHLLNFSGL